MENQWRPFLDANFFLFLRFTFRHPQETLTNPFRTSRNRTILHTQYLDNPKPSKASKAL